MSRDGADHTREPIISVLGHVDHGKTTILDSIRESVVASREAGGITQHIGATDVPFEVIEEYCGGMLDKSRIRMPIRGLLFVDTPGHEAFTNLRRRGGSVADLAVLVVDVNEGLKPQTEESIEILKQYKTPFVVAANKVDLIHGWQDGVKPKDQLPHVQSEFNDKAYKLIGDLSMRGFDCDFFQNIKDFSKSVAVIPVSAKTGEGIKELLLVLIGLAQTYLSEKLAVGLESPAKGTILEVKETKGLGTTLDAIIYDGTIRVNDSIVVGAREPIVTRVKALLRPRALDEMRDPKKQFKQVRSVYAASGVKIVAPNLESAMPGAPVYVGGEELVEAVKSEIGEVEFTRDDIGVIVRADTLGSLEAMVRILEAAEIPVKKGSIGKVNKQDVVEAGAVSKENLYYGLIMAFNTPVLADAETLAQDTNIPIIGSSIIYKILEDYNEWVAKTKEIERMELAKCVASPCKFKILPNHTFRQSKPAIVGVEVLAGKLHSGCRLIGEDGKVMGRVRGIQSGGENVAEAKSGEQVAVSIDDVVVGKHLSEEDVVYTFLSNQDRDKLIVDDLTDEEKDVLRELKQIKKRR
ncbi:MAG: translation initiation factor IF-2 [Candidatus Altiarchaeales archaeon]|nr:translation initiation factor IF-2 [Candidatus Altiarchaeales archaeon]MBD3415868.1 translation initiation factor IF-2 [Candidatus Altiarchaeales archaeon]